MWPGQQPPGGEQNPQDPNQNPYQQPGYQQAGYEQPGYRQAGHQQAARQQPNPYQQPGFQQPNPYQQPGGPQPGGQWGPPMPPGAPRPPDGKRKRTAIAIGTAVAVVAAAVVAGVFLFQDGDGKKKEEAKVGQNASPTAGPSSSASGSASGAGADSDSGRGSDSQGGSEEDPADNPRSGSSDVKPVISGWKAVANPLRHDAFDVPPDWHVASPGLTTGFQDDKGQGGVGMTGPAFYKPDVCAKDTRQGGAGTKGAQSAKSPAQAAEIEALNWVYYAYDTKRTGHLSGTKSQPFKSDHGLTGFWSSAKVTGVEKTDKCSSDGKAFTVSYKDTAGDLATWVLYTDVGVKDELSDATIKKIMSTLRPLPVS
ncbi:hypothetical protein AB0A77_20205 [Streptomyces varsoviensis]|uniref:hypothetical protein n=1 Tax=Streptomyces varsoviensis TaxID=67373 RepID=UPI00340A6792